jgi:hypothetical protein
MKSLILLILLLPNLANARQLDMVAMGHDVLKMGILQGILAKELCTCVFVSEVGGPALDPKKRLDKCVERSNLPISDQIMSMMAGLKVLSEPKAVFVKVKTIGSIVSLLSAENAMATYEGPKIGCRLLRKDEIPKKFPKQSAGEEDSD